MSFTSLAAAAKAITRSGRGAVRRLDLSASEDLECRNLMCEKLGEACACKLARFVQQSAAGLADLEALDLSNSRLKVLPTAVFELLPKLQELRLANNGIRELPVEVGFLRELRILDVRDNNLEKLPVQELESISTLEAILVNGNPPLTLKNLSEIESLSRKVDAETK